MTFTLKPIRFGIFLLLIGLFLGLAPVEKSWGETDLLDLDQEFELDQADDLDSTSELDLVYEFAVGKDTNLSRLATAS